MTAAKLLSGLVARAAFRHGATARIGRLVRERGREGYFEKVSRTPRGVPRKYPDGKGGPGELVYMRTKGGGVEMMKDPASWFRVIDEMEGEL